MKNSGCTPGRCKILGARLKSPTYLWSAWDSKQIRLPRTERCHKAATWRNCVRWGRGPDKTAQLWHSSGQTASTWSGCECGRTDSSLGPTVRRSGRDPLKQYQTEPIYNIKFHTLKISTVVLWVTTFSLVVIGRILLKCDGTRWRTLGEVKRKLANGVGSQYSSLYLGTWCIQHYYRWCTHLGCQ